MLPPIAATDLTVADSMENGGARREPHANPMLKERFDVRCQRRRGSPDSDEIIFAKRRRVWSRGAVGHEASTTLSIIRR